MDWRLLRYLDFYRSTGLEQSTVVHLPLEDNYTINRTDDSNKGKGHYS